MSKGRVLLVEDNLDNRELVRFLLERYQYEVITAQSGREGLELARKEKPDLILMDLSLPEMDGWTVAGTLKQDAVTADIPLFALTAHTLPGDRKRAFDSGFDGYLSKPINVTTFEAVIHDAIHKRSDMKKE